MNSFINKTLTLITCALAMVITSCSHDDNYDVLSKEDIASKIIGTWECIEGDDNVQPQRIEYHENGTYTYFNQYDDIWYPGNDKANIYTQDGNQLELKWTNSADKQENEKWVVVSIDENTMKWVSMRDPKDTSKTTKTRTWKKLETLTDEKIQSLIVGNWDHASSKYYDIDGDKLVETSTSPDTDIAAQRCFNSDNTFQEILLFPENEEMGHEEEEFIQSGTYLIDGKKIKLTVIDEETGVAKHNLENGVYDINEETLQTIEFIKKENLTGKYKYDLIVVTTWKKLPDFTPWQNAR